MLIKASHDITRISDSADVNMSNYMESLSFINNLYKFLNNIKMVVSVNEFVFIPTFKGSVTCERFGISSKEYENDMRRFLIKSELFLEDEIRENIREKMGILCDSITFKNNVIEFIFK